MPRTIEVLFEPFDACPKEHVLFSAADDVSGHCEMSSRGTLHGRVYDWLDRVLPPGN